ncbi:hypothetical protein SCUCBS95973_007598 [Sporothrix curviconia]|uniref:Uncharacterized protein n=1 Tax=Sporothrix curviconia TaxID=1260050 RepID=A0ABP0CHF1_9PEZI
MKNIASLAVAAAYLAAVAEARRSSFFARNNAQRSWQPAQQTATSASAPAALDIADDLAHMPQLALHAAGAAEAPATTAAPALGDRLLKRDSTDNTCGYVSGISSLSLYCDVTDLCVANSINSMVGCCPDSSTTCPIPTTCYPSSDSSLYTTDNGYTLWCGSSAYPECVTHYYVDDIFTGYTLLGCGKTEAVDKVSYLATDASSSTSSSSKTTKTSSKSSTTPASSTPGTTTSSSSSAASSSAGAGGGSSGDGGGGSSGGKKSNTGAIAGGVVGGVAGLALIALGAFYLLRNRNNSAVNNSVAGAGAGAATSGAGVPPPAGGAPPMSQMPQQPYYGGAGGDPALGYGAATVAGGVAGAGAAAAYQYPNQQQQQQFYPSQEQQYGGYLPQAQQQQQETKVYDPYSPAGQQYDPNAAAAAAAAAAGVAAGASTPGSPPLVQSPQSGYHDVSAYGSPSAPTDGAHISPDENIAPFSAPPPAAGMDFHSGPIPTTLDVAELPTERGHGNMQELA